MNQLPFGGEPIAPQLISAEPFMQHAQQASEVTDLVIEGDLPDDASTGSVALIADEAYLRAHELSGPTQYGGNILPRFTPVQARVDSHRAVLRAINPEGGIFATAGISLKAVMESALTQKRSRIARVGMVAKTAVTGGMAVAIAASQPLENVIPGLHAVRQSASRKTRDII